VSEWSYYHRVDEQFHQRVGTASCLETAVVYHQNLAEPYATSPPTIEKLHTSILDQIAPVAAPRAGRVEEAWEVSRKHVDILHRTMFMGFRGKRIRESRSN